MGDERHRTLVDLAFQVLRRSVIEGTLGPGQPLPVNRLAKGLAMSRTPIRHALIELHAAGLVELQAHHQARVAELSAEDLADLYRVRLLLEPLAARSAAECFDAGQARAATRALRCHRNALERGDVANSFDPHTQFHFVLYSSSGSRWLLRLIDQLWHCAERYRIALISASPDCLERWCEQHERVLAACIHHDPDLAEHELHDHLSSTESYLSAALEGRPGSEHSNPGGPAPTPTLNAQSDRLRDFEIAPGLQFGPPSRRVLSGSLAHRAESFGPRPCG